MADNPKSLASLADDLERHADFWCKLPDGYCRCEKLDAKRYPDGSCDFCRGDDNIRKAAAALRAPTIAADERCQNPRRAKSAAEVSAKFRSDPERNRLYLESQKSLGITAAFATPSPTMAADPEVLDCVGECSFRDREHTHYRNTVHVAPSPTIAAPSPSNENTCENDGDRCEYSRTDCAADGSFNCQTHPSPSNEVTAEMVEAGFAAQCEELPEFGNENRENMMRVARVTIEAALKARKPADEVQANE